METNLKTLFEGQAIKSEMVVLIVEKWDLHPTMEEKSAMLVNQSLRPPGRDQSTSKRLIDLNTS